MAAEPAFMLGDSFGVVMAIVALLKPSVGVPAALLFLGV